MTKLKLLMTKLNCKEISSKKQENHFMNKNQIFIKSGTEYKKMTKELLTASNLAELIGDRKGVPSKQEQVQIQNEDRYLPA